MEIHFVLLTVLLTAMLTPLAVSLM